MANVNNGRTEREIEYKIVEKIGVIETQQNGWNKELNIVVWNNGTPKFDIREWSADHTRMSRGITLLEREAANLAALLAQKFGIAYEPAAKPEENFMVDYEDDAAEDAASADLPL